MHINNKSLNLSKTLEKLYKHIPPTEFLAKLAKGVSYLVVYYMVSQFASLKLLGLLVVISTTNTFFSIIADLGVSQATVSLVSKHFTNTPKLNGVIYKTYSVTIFQSLLSSTLLFISAPWISSNILHQEVTFLLRCTALWLPAIFLTRYYNNLFKGFRDSRFIHIPTLVLEVLKIEVLVIALALQKFNATYIVLGWTICYCVSGGFYFFLIQRSLFRKKIDSEGLENTGLKEIFRAVSELGELDIIKELTPCLFILSIGIFFSLEELGAFAVCYQAVSVSMLFFVPIFANLEAALFRAFRTKDKEGIKSSFIIVFKYSIFACYITLAFWLFFGENILFFISPDLPDKKRMLDVLALAMFFEGLNLALNSLLYGLNQALFIKRVQYWIPVLFTMSTFLIIPHLSLFQTSVLISFVPVFSAGLNLSKIENIFPLDIHKELEKLTWLPIILLGVYWFDGPFIIFIFALLYWSIVLKPFSKNEYKTLYHKQ